MSPASLLFLLLASAVASRRPGRRIGVLPEGEEGGDVRRAIPGEPGDDYPTFGAVPRTSFSCHGRAEGFYTDPEARCQVFHICSLKTGSMAKQSFLCPNGTVFNRQVNTCDWWNKVHCGNDGYQPPLYTTSGRRIIQTSTEPYLGDERNIGTILKGNANRPRNNRVDQPVERHQHTQAGGENKVHRNKESTKNLSLKNNRGFRNEYNSVSSTNPPTTTVLSSTTDHSLKVELISPAFSSLLPKSSPVTEVSIKPRVQYTHSLKYASDSPIYSLNPIVQVARDSSLLSTFTTSHSKDNEYFGDNNGEVSSGKSKQPVQRYVVDSVLPQYGKNTPEDISPSLDRTPVRPDQNGNRVGDSDSGIDSINPEVFSDIVEGISNLEGNTDETPTTQSNIDSTTESNDNGPLGSSEDDFEEQKVNNEEDNLSDSLPSQFPTGLDSSNADDGNNNSQTGAKTSSSQFPTGLDSSNADDGNNNSQTGAKTSSSLFTVNANAQVPTNTQNNESEKNIPPLIQVSGGYSFSPAGDRDSNNNERKQFKVSNSFSVQDQFSTAAPISDPQLNVNNADSFPGKESSQGTQGFNDFSTQKPLFTPTTDVPFNGIQNEPGSVANQNNNDNRQNGNINNNQFQSGLGIATQTGGQLPNNFVPNEYGITSQIYTGDGTRPNIFGPSEETTAPQISSFNYPSFSTGTNENSNFPDAIREQISARPINTQPQNIGGTQVDSTRDNSQKPSKNYLPSSFESSLLPDIPGIIREQPISSTPGSTQPIDFGSTFSNTKEGNQITLGVNTLDAGFNRSTFSTNAPPSNVYNNQFPIFENNRESINYGFPQFTNNFPIQNQPLPVPGHYITHAPPPVVRPYGYQYVNPHQNVNNYNNFYQRQNFIGQTQTGAAVGYSQSLFTSTPPSLMYNPSARFPSTPQTIPLVMGYSSTFVSQNVHTSNPPVTGAPPSSSPYYPHVFPGNMVTFGPKPAFENSHITLPALPPQSIFYSSYPTFNYTPQSFTGTSVPSTQFTGNPIIETSTPPSQMSMTVSSIPTAQTTPNPISETSLTPPPELLGLNPIPGISTTSELPDYTQSQGSNGGIINENQDYEKILQESIGTVGYQSTPFPLSSSQATNTSIASLSTYTNDDMRKINNGFNVSPGFSISPSVQTFSESTTISPYPTVTGNIDSSTLRMFSSSQAPFIENTFNPSTVSSIPSSGGASGNNLFNFPSVQGNVGLVSASTPSSVDFSRQNANTGSFRVANGGAQQLQIGVGFSTPKPFVDFNYPLAYLPPQLHSTLLPDYTHLGEQLFRPADLYSINGLHRSTEPTTSGNFAPDIVRSISFSFDTPEELEQFQQARAKGLFNR